MMNPSWALTVVGLCFGGLAWGIGRVESRAKTCAVHDRRAGAIARVVGVFCGFAAVGLLAIAVSFWRSGQ
jgi:hypothetical protein